jgi:hypothetical protein
MSFENNGTRFYPVKTGDFHVRVVIEVLESEPFPNTAFEENGEQ